MPQTLFFRPSKLFFRSSPSLVDRPDCLPACHAAKKEEDDEERENPVVIVIYFPSDKHMNNLQYFPAFQREFRILLYVLLLDRYSY